MATIGVDPNGRKRVLFFASDGKRKTVRLGAIPMRVAEGFKTKVETILGDIIIGRPHDAETAKWLRDLDPKMRARLVRAGLVTGTVRVDMSLGAFLEQHLAAMAVKASTLTMYGHTRRCLESFFGKERVVRTIGPADGDRFRQWLRDEEGLSDATISKRIVVARQAFKRALKWKVADENPFAEVKAGPQTNKARMFFVTREMADSVLDKCPDTQWKLLFALSRYGGLRCPSEHLALRWMDVDWDKGRLVVHSSKTEHHDGGDCRIIPLFPELRPLLEAAWAEAVEGGSPYVITKYRDTNSNLRTHLCRIIKRAGLAPWPKLFHNLRSSRQTELAEQYPIHVVCAWLGNSQAVAQAHYLQVHDLHFAHATLGPTAAAKEAAPEKAARNPARTTQEYAGAGGEDPPHHPLPPMQKPAEIPAGSRVFPRRDESQSGPDWIRPPRPNPRENIILCRQAQ
jgi:integrase